MPVRFWDHWLQRPAPHLIAYVVGERRDLTPHADREHREAEWDVSADGSTVVITSSTAAAADGVCDVSLLVIDVTSGASHELGRAPLSSSASPLFSPDGSQIACVRDERRKGQAPYPRLWLYPARSPGAAGRLLTSWEPWPAPCCWTRDGRAVLVTADVRGDVPIVSVDVQTGSVSRLTRVESGGSHGSVQLTRDGRTVVGLRHRHTHPPEPFRLALGPAGATSQAERSCSRRSAALIRRCSPSSGGASRWRWQPRTAAASCPSCSPRTAPARTPCCSGCTAAP